MCTYIKAVCHVFAFSASHNEESISANQNDSFLHARQGEGPLFSLTTLFCSTHTLKYTHTATYRCQYFTSSQMNTLLLCAVYMQFYAHILLVSVTLCGQFCSVCLVLCFVFILCLCWNKVLDILSLFCLKSVLWVYVVCSTIVLSVLCAVFSCLCRFSLMS